MKRRAWYWLLLIPFIATMWPPFYNRHDPVILGFPFFYWYQVGWIALTAVLSWIVLVLSKDPGDV